MTGITQHGDDNGSPNVSPADSDTRPNRVGLFLLKVPTISANLTAEVFRYIFDGL